MAAIKFLPANHSLLFNTALTGVDNYSKYAGQAKTIWGVDMVLSSLAHSGILDAVVQDAQPGNNNQLWVKPNNPPEAAASTVQIYDSTAGGGTWQPATLSRFAGLMARVGGYTTATGSGLLTTVATGDSLSGDGKTATPLAVQVKNSVTIKGSLVTGGLQLDFIADAAQATATNDPLSIVSTPATATDYGVFLGKTPSAVTGTSKQMNATRHVDPRYFLANYHATTFAKSYSAMVNAPTTPDNKKLPWFDLNDSVVAFKLWDDLTSVWRASTLDELTRNLYAMRQSGLIDFKTANVAPTLAADKLIPWVDISTSPAVAKKWNGTAWVAIAPGDLLKLMADYAAANGNSITGATAPFTIGTFVSPLIPDYNNGDVQTMVMTANTQLNAPTNIAVGKDFIIHLIQDGTGGRVITFDTANMQFDDGNTVPTFKTGANTRTSIVGHMVTATKAILSLKGTGFAI